MRVKNYVRIAAAATVPATVLVTTALMGAVGASAAQDPKGDDGTVKIVEVGSPKNSEEANDPKICDFFIRADGFDGVEELDYEIIEGPPFKDEPAREGKIELNGDGDGDSDPISPKLPDGQYKLNVTFEGQKSSDAKHKVFKVDCPDPEPEEETTGGGGTDPQDETDPAEDAGDETPAEDDETPAEDDETPAEEDETPAEEDDTPAGENETPNEEETQEVTPSETDSADTPATDDGLESQAQEIGRAHV